MTVDPNFHFGICMCLVDETFLEFHHFEHLLQALMKPDGFRLHLLAPAYHPQYNLFYCVSYHLARLPGFTSSSCWHNGVTATVGFDTIPPINFRILLCFNLDIIATMKHTESRHASYRTNLLLITWCALNGQWWSSWHLLITELVMDGSSLAIRYLY